MTRGFPLHLSAVDPSELFGLNDLNGILVTQRADGDDMLRLPGGAIVEGWSSAPDFPREPEAARRK